MQILPGDLGENRALAIIRLRAAMGNGAQGSHVAKAFVQNGGTADAASAARAALVDPDVPQETKPRRAGFWTRFWAGGTGLSPEASRSAVHSMRHMIGGMAGGLGGGSMGFIAPATVMMTAAHEPIVAGIFFTLGLAMMGTGFAVPRFMLTGYAKKPLTAAEIETLINAENDPTEKAFLRAVAEVVQTPAALLGTQTEDEIKAALETLGDAIDKLPRVVSPSESAQTLRDEARKALVDANNEPDALIAASLRRRAEAQAKTADAAERSTLILRRADALRREIEAQIDALRMGLSTLDVSQTDTPQNTQSAQTAAAHLTQLAQSIQIVARQSGSFADARNEVDSWTEQAAPQPAPTAANGDTWPARPVETAAPDVVTVGRTTAH